MSLSSEQAKIAEQYTSAENINKKAVVHHSSEETNFDKWLKDGIQAYQADQEIASQQDGKFQTYKQTTDQETLRNESLKKADLVHGDGDGLVEIHELNKAKQEINIAYQQ